MLFKDEVVIKIKSGKGGAGSKSFRREKYIPNGGPDGGDGGKGGDIIFYSSIHLDSLSHLHKNQIFSAEDGGNGLPQKKFGKKGKSIIVEVPVGTVVKDCETDDILYDFVKEDEKIVILKGGRGGLGNVHFKSSVNQSPFYAQEGEASEKKIVKLELKTIAQIGFVGFPNAGKSTLLSQITNAKPEIANYPFTTLVPNIGILEYQDTYSHLLIADIPGIIEGAHVGKGLGLQFLRHVERTSVLLYLIDGSDKALETYEKLYHEVKEYSTILTQKKYLIAVNKMDLLDEEKQKEIKDTFKEKGLSIIFISAIARMNLNELKTELYNVYSQSIQERKASYQLDELKNAHQKNTSSPLESLNMEDIL